MLDFRIYRTTGSLTVLSTLLNSQAIMLCGNYLSLFFECNNRGINTQPDVVMKFSF